MRQYTPYTTGSFNNLVENINKWEHTNKKDESHYGRKVMLQLKAAYFKMMQCKFGSKISA